MDRIYIVVKRLKINHYVAETIMATNSKDKADKLSRDLNDCSFDSDFFIEEFVPDQLCEEFKDDLLLLIKDAKRSYEIMKSLLE